MNPSTEWNLAAIPPMIGAGLLPAELIPVEWEDLVRGGLRILAERKRDRCAAAKREILER